MKIRKNICLDQEVIDLATEKAKELGLSFSSYLTLLINQDSKDVVMVKSQSEKVVEVKNDKVISAIDDVMNFTF